jgi:hypothetical protein
MATHRNGHPSLARALIEGLEVPGSNLGHGRFLFPTIP